MKRPIMLLLGGLCAFGSGLAGTLVLGGLPQATAQPEPPLPAPPPASPSDPLLELSDRFAAIVRQISPSVVAIEARKSIVAKNPTDTQRAVEESGSGFLFRWEQIPGLLVLTNNHVIDQATDQDITVHTADNRLLHPTRVWTDPESDIAVLQVNATELIPVALGDSDQVRVGQWVLAFGSPFGLNQTVTHGIISARERGQISLGSTIRIKDFLQTDAAINPGSSGGPLVNLRGEVIGINTAIASRSGSHSGVAFAIPINLALSIVRELVQNGKVQRGYLGVQLAAAMELTQAEKLGLRRVQGALVEVVYPNTPAALAGLKVDDVILQVDSIDVRNENHLINLISSLPVGQRVSLQVWRNKATRLTEVVVGDWTKARNQLAELR